MLSYIARASDEKFHGNPEDSLHVPGGGLATKDRSVEGIESHVLDSSPLLEAFGNAKTSRNVNSSRFGKFIQIDIRTDTGNIPSGRINTYLLEKSRVTKCSVGERSFHIFYQMLAHNETASKQGLDNRDPESYGFLKNQNENKIEGVDDSKQMDQTIQCMKNIGFTEEQMEQCWQILASILRLGRVTYAENDADEAHFSSADAETEIRIAAGLLGIQADPLIKVLTTKQTKYPGQVIESPFRLNEAISARNSLCKTIYGRLFDWIVSKVNESISSKMYQGDNQFDEEMSSVHSIGLLDIFGFEAFKTNSFEQLCINYANEKLQQHFNQHMVALEIEEYRYELGDEALETIDFTDSSECLELFESATLKKPSLFKLVDDEGAIRGNDENLLSKFHDFYLNKHPNPHYAKGSRFETPQFKIKHYAGDVVYDIEGFVEKNKDFLSDFIVETVQSTDMSLLKTLFPSNAITRKGTKLAGYSLSSQFKDQLNRLLETINESVPRYVRCIKPNSKASADPLDMEDEAVAEQLKAGSILEAVRIRKLGYGYRLGYQDFADKFWQICGELIFDAD